MIIESRALPQSDNCETGLGLASSDCNCGRAVFRDCETGHPERQGELRSDLRKWMLLSASFITAVLMGVALARH